MSTVGVPELDAPAPGILTFIPRTLNFLEGIEENCCESRRIALYAEFAYVEASSIISVKLVH